MADAIAFTPEPDEIVQFLKQTVQYQQVCRSILSQRIIQKTAQERGVSVGPEDIQREADEFRRKNRLERANDTLAWLNDQQISPEEWEAGISDNLLSQKLMETMFGPEIERSFAENRLNFDRVSFYQIVIADDKLAQEVFYQIEEEEISFYEAARLYDVDEQRRDRCGYEGLVYRWALKAEIAPVVFAASPGQVTAPVRTEHGHHLLMIDRFIPAELSSELRQELLNRLFQEWLDGEVSYLLHNQ
jgi:parvulin-like peptidyl-prolyl isomerase